MVPWSTQTDGEKMKKPLEIEFKVGLFVTLGLGLIMFAIVILGGADSIFSRSNRYSIHFPSVDGLITGAKVVLGGLQVGTVESADFDSTEKDVKVNIKVFRKYEELIRKDSTAEILTQGVLGDKFISIMPGSQETETLPDKSEIPNRPTKDLAQFLTKGDQLMVSLNSIARSLDKIFKGFEKKNRSEVFFDGMSATATNLAEASKKLNTELDSVQLKSSIKNLNLILEKINNGTGTLGALVNDPGLYYDAKALLGGANRNKIVRNLVRKTIKASEEADSKKDAKEKTD